MDNKSLIGLVIAAIGVAAVPSITFIYSQGENAAIQLQLSESIKILNTSVVSLTEKTSQLSSDLRSEIVKTEHLREDVKKYTRKQDEIEKKVNLVSEEVVRLKTFHN